MKNLTVFGELNAGLGVLFLVFGLLLFIGQFDGQLNLEGQYLSLSFFFLAIALFFIASLATKK